MSGGQRKRITFADLVSARLPSASTPGPENRPESNSSEAELTRDATPTHISTPEEGTPASLPPAPSRPSEARRDPDPATVAPPDGLASVDEVETDAASQEPARENQGSTTAESRSPHDWQSPDDCQSPDVRRTRGDRGASQNDCQPPHDWQSSDDRQSYGDRQPLKEVKGFLRLPNTVVDSLLPTLDVYEQATFIQLYRLSHGFGNHTCKISLPALQARTGLKPTSMKQAIARLQARGVVEKVAAEIGFGRDQGITYWVSPDGRQTYGDWQSPRGSQSPGDHNKRKEILKENFLKGGLTPEQIKACPDCQGVGMWYPEGPGKGVARCLHPSLRARR